MSWIDVDINELNVETEKADKGGMPEPGVYECTIKECFLDKTTNGTAFVNFELVSGTVPDVEEFKIVGWDVNRMIKKSTGETKNNKGRYFSGLIILNKMAKCIGKDVSQLTPTKKIVNVFGKDKEVFSLNDLVGKKMTFGIRHKKYWNQDGDEKLKLDIAGVCCIEDKECGVKLVSRIEKNPVVKDKSNKPSEEKPLIDDNNIPF